MADDKKIGFNGSGSKKRTEDRPSDHQAEAAAALPEVLESISTLAPEARSWLIAALNGLYGGEPTQRSRTERSTRDAKAATGSQGEGVQYAEFVDLFNRCGHPKSAPQKALVAGYWLQIVQGGESFRSGDVGKELKAVGSGVANPADALGKLARSKPALVYKAGQDGRSVLYKLSSAGINVVEEMVAAG